MPVEQPYVEQDRNYVYDTNTGTWVRMTQPASSGSAGDVNIVSDSVGLAKQAQLPASLGQKTSANSLSVVVASDNTVAVSAASLPLPSGAANQTKQDTGNASLASIDGKITAVDTGAVVVASSALPTGAANQTKQDTGNTSLASIDSKITAVNTGAVVVSSSALPALAATSTKQSDGSQKTQIVDGSGNVIGSTTNALDVNIKSSTSITANPSAPSTSSVSSVASSATSVTLLSSNASRKKFLIFNDSTQTLYVKLGTTASSSDYTIQLSSNQWYESFPNDYTGRIDGIWSSANGNARITELT